MHRASSLPKSPSTTKHQPTSNQSRKRIKTAKKLKQIATKKFSTTNDNDFEFDELPAFKPTSIRTTPKQSQPTQKVQQQKDFLKADSPAKQIGASTEIAGSSTISVNADGSVSHKTPPQPYISYKLKSEDGGLDKIPLNNTVIVDQHGNRQNHDALYGMDPKFHEMLKRKTPLTPLSNEMRQHIIFRGPLSMSEYMTFCLSHPQHGYYMQRNAIGKKGDFVTSPEISPLFSEMMGIWGVSTWMRMGRPDNIQIVELGPGRGTLMQDFLATAERFPDFYNALSIHFVDNSGPMRKLQRQALDVDLDLELMKFHPTNSDTHLARDDLVDGAGDPILDDERSQAAAMTFKNKQNVSLQGMTEAEYEKKQLDLIEDMTSLLSTSSTLREEINSELSQLKVLNPDQQSHQVGLSQLRPELLAKIKNLESEFASKIQASNQLSGLQGGLDTFNHAMENHLKQKQGSNQQGGTGTGDAKKTKTPQEFLDSFLRLSSGQLTLSDYNNLFGSEADSNDVLAAAQRRMQGDEFDDENGWIWTDKPSPKVAHEIEQLQQEERDLQSRLSIILPRVVIPSYMSPDQQALKHQQHQERISKMLDDDPVFAEKIGSITTRLEAVAQSIADLKASMYNEKVYDKKAHKYNKYMTTPVTCGVTRAKFDSLRSSSSSSTPQSPPPSSAPINFDPFATETSAKEVVKKIGTQTDKLKKELPVSWHWTLLDVPSTAPCIILAHEFFDALPVHQFQYTQRGWREILVDADDTMETPHHFKYVLSPNPTPASMSLFQPTLLLAFDEQGNRLPPVEQPTDAPASSASTPTPAPKLLPFGQGGTRTIAQAAAERALKLAQEQAEVEAKRKTPAASGAAGAAGKHIILGADGLPLIKTEQSTIQTEINFPSISESFSKLANPLITPDDVKIISSVQGSSTIIGLDETPIGSTKITSAQDEQQVLDIDARFKRYNTAAQTNQVDSYNQMHGIDRAFEAGIEQTDTPQGVLQNSPFIREKLKSRNKIGDTFESSPVSLMWAEQIALRLMKNGGAALVIDYGDNDLGQLTPKDYESDSYNAYGIDTSRGHMFRQLSLQGIKGHQHADVLQEPGFVDLSAHVNFAALAAAFKKTEQLTTSLLRRPRGTADHQRVLDMLRLSPNGDLDPETFTPRTLHITRAIPQGSLLQQLGLDDRFQKLLKNCRTEAEQVALFESVNRLVDPSQMGELFKAMTVYTDMSRPPVGWDSHVVRKEYEAHAHYDDNQRVKQDEFEKAEIARMEGEYHERTRMMNERKRQKNQYKMQQEEAYEQRLKQAAKGAGVDVSYNQSFIGAPELNELQTLQSSNVSDASLALEKLQKDRDAEVNKGFYVIDRNKYNGRD